MRKFRRIVLSFALIFHVIWCQASVGLPSLIADGMVIQRDLPIILWGSADINETIKLEFSENIYHIVADTDGNWSITLPPMEAGGPYTMHINDTLVIDDIWIGDVWLCSGQSNMELPVSRVMEKYADEVNSYSNVLIRQLKVPLSYDFNNPQKDIQSTSWQSLNPEHALSFSAIAYFFARDLYEREQVPIGLINASVGGSPAEAWISTDYLQAFPHYLNELNICKSDSYRKQIQELESLNQNLWINTVNDADPGLKEKPSWYHSDYDDVNWQVLDLGDQSWNSDGLNPLNGSHWFRKTIVLPNDLSGKEAQLRLGCIVDADSVFVNNQFVGSTSYQYPPRIYSVPSDILSVGENTIAIRLLSHRGFPEFVDEKPYELKIGEHSILLEEQWKYRSGARMPQLDNSTFFHYKPTGLYNAMIAPLKDYAIKGVLWYQGESNVNRYNEYNVLMENLINNWRSLWQQPDLPFLMVQLTGFMKNGSPQDISYWAELRNQQSKVSHKLANVGLAITTDLGEWNDIHPLNKKNVGKRLSLLAANIAYGHKDVVCTGPEVESVRQSKKKQILSFKPSTNDLKNVSELKCFVVEDNKGDFYPVKAMIANQEVIVWSDNVRQPKYLYYAWSNNPQEANLKNTLGLPAAPFKISIEKIKK